MGLRCKRCGSEEQTRNGFMRGQQRYRCKACGLNFTDTPPRGMPLQVKVTAILLYVSGLSMNRTAKLLGVSTPSVMAWIAQVAKDHAPKPTPEGRALVIELDEMWHYLKKRPTSSGCGRLGIVLQADWLIGNAAVVIAPPWSDSSPAEALEPAPLLHRRLGGLSGGDPARPALRRQGRDPWDRARPCPPAALARPLPPALNRGLQGQAHGRCLDRSVRALRRK